MVTLYLCVEGGGSDSTDLRAECRRGFRTLLERAGFAGRMPRLVACGGRREAFNAFCNHLALGHAVLLLVDSEEEVSAASPWAHVAQRKGDGWKQPAGSTDDHLHFMVRSMEGWLLADRDALAEYYGSGFATNQLPPQKPVDTIDRHDAVKALEAASKHTRKGKYAKGEHSFDLLCRVSPTKVRKEAWAERFFVALNKTL